MEDADRLARLETHAEHFQTQLTRVEGDVKELRRDLDALSLRMEKGFAETNATIAALALTMERGFAALGATIAAQALVTEKNVATLALRTEKSMHRVQIGFLMTGASLLAIVAQALHWL